MTEQQRAAAGRIAVAMEEESGRVFLLHGITGSGKTEVYLDAIGRTLNRGKGAIVLVPEISLTPQMVSRFRSRFGDTVAVIHSQLSVGERYDEWARIRPGGGPGGDRRPIGGICPGGGHRAHGYR